MSRLLGIRKKSDRFAQTNPTGSYVLKSSNLLFTDENVLGVFSSLQASFPSKISFTIVLGRGSSKLLFAPNVIVFF